MPNMTEFHALFIGGPWDGRMLTDPGLPIIEVPVPEQRPFTDPVADLVEPLCVKSHIYRRFTFQGSIYSRRGTGTIEKVFVYYTHESNSPSEVIRILFNTYEQFCRKKISETVR